LGPLRPQEVGEAVRHGAIVVDIRPEFQRRMDGEIPGAVVIERNHLEWRLHPASAGRIGEAVDVDVHWIVICDEGYASTLTLSSHPWQQGQLLSPRPARTTSSATRELIGLVDDFSFTGPCHEIV